MIIHRILSRNLSIAAVTLCPLFAESPTPVFDVTEVHASARAANPYTFLSGGVLRDGRYDLRKATMLDLIRIAYGVDADNVVGGPSWLELDRFDVAGKAPPSTPPETVKLMLQGLLADRFKLVVHKDTRPLPAFALTLGKGKPNLKEADAPSPLRGQAAPYPDAGGCQSPAQVQPGFSMLSCRNVTMQALAQILNGRAGDYLTIPVIDSTGLKGAWDFDLKWNSRSQILPAGADRLTIFTAVEKQLGLTLALEKAPKPVFVVDRVNEKPTPDPPGVGQALPPRLTVFDVAEIKPSRPDEPGYFKNYPSGRFEFRATDMRILIATAWDVDWDHADEAIVGIPKWAGSRNFDVTAKTAPAPEAPPGGGFIDDDLRLMLRNLLIERFQMKTHTEERLVPAYTLSAVKPKLKKADPSNRSACKVAGIVPNDPRDQNPRLARLLTCQNMSMAEFAEQLQGLEAATIPNPVEDATGLKGSWDFSLSYTPAYLLQGRDAIPGTGGAASEPSGGVSLAEAISRQLGLKLEMRKRMLPVVVIDHMEEKPVDN